MRRSPFCCVLAAILAVTLVGCGGSNQAEPQPEPAQETTIEQNKEPKFETAPKAPEYGDSATIGALTVSFPDGWKTADAGEGNLYVYPDYGGMMYIVESTFSTYVDDTEDAFDQITAGMENDGVFDVEDEHTSFRVSSLDAYRAKMYGTVESTKFAGWVEIVFYENKACTVIFLVAEEDFAEKSDEIISILDTITIDTSASNSGGSKTSTGSSSKSTESQPAPAPSAPAPSNDSPTVSQANALERAQSYLSFMPFSREGLIEQMEYEEFSHDDAVYAVDHCGADWMAQAVAKAKSYLDVTAFSYTGLIEQLEYEGFTHEEAVHGADSCGADWYEQAELKAEQYLSFMSFSHDELVDQLEFEGFTHDQAEHGVTAAGL